MMPKSRDSEAHAYSFIKEYLELQGWIVKNPNRFPEGQVYTETECLDHTEIKKQLGKKHPENIVKISETEFYIIEAKASKEQIEIALNQAQERYADKINKSNTIKANIISGVAGNPADGFIVKSRYRKNGKFYPILINGKEITGFVSPQIADLLISKNSPNIEDLPIDETAFLKTAEEINGILHLGAINKNYRARVMAALLLAMVDETRPNVDASPRILIKEINSRAENVLIKNKKPEFFECIKIALPPSPDNHIKFKNALVQTIQELENLNIRSAMNSGADILGKFYEVFLKYGNGAKEIGIVLTPRHITKFAAECLDISAHDIIYDPTCGTGGFLVAALDIARKQGKKDDLDFFKKNGLFGVEQEPEVAALAIVNMIFRGDGKNNIIEGNCFSKTLIAKRINGKTTATFVNNSELPKVHSPAATKVLMNPPFALKKSDEKEYAFVDHALSQLQDSGMLFSVLPFSVMIEQGKAKAWRKELLEKNTLVSVISFPPDLFYPVGVYSLGIIIRKGIPHKQNQKVYWIRAQNDGFIKKKGKRLPSKKAKNDYNFILPLLRDFIKGEHNKIKTIPEFQKLSPIDFSDDSLELVSEAYLDSKKPDEKHMQKEVDRLVRGSVAYLIKFGKEGKIFEKNQ